MNAAKGKRILVVEDEALIAAMIIDMLAELGATVVGPATTLQSGLEMAASGVIDAAILDVNIRSDRVDPIAAELRQRAIPLVFATGYGASVKALAAGAPILEKPYSLQKLQSALNKALEPTSAPPTAKLRDPASERP